MADQDFSTTQTTTHTATVHRVTMDGARPYLDFSYLSTLPGIVKIIEATLDFICFICVIVGPFPGYGGAGWGTFVSISAFIVTTVLLIMYIFHMIEALQVIPWLLVEMLFCGLWTFFYMIASCVLASFSAKMRHVQGSSALIAFAEMIYCFAWTSFFFLASIILATMAGTRPTIEGKPDEKVDMSPYAAAAFFGFSAMIAYGFDCFLKFRSWRYGEVAQGNPPTPNA